MFTSWHQVEDWILDNNIKKWAFFKTNPLARPEDKLLNDRIVDSSNWENTDDSRKLELTKKYLETFGERCYGVGYKSESGTKGGMFCEVCLSSPTQQTVGAAPQVPMVGSIDEQALTERIRKELQLDYEKREMERERKELEKERKAFEQDKHDAVGAIVGILRPYLPALKQVAGIAGLDAPADVTAERIHVPQDTPEDGEQDKETASGLRDAGETQEQEQSPFTDEEADQLFALMTRFKKVEPEYLKLIENVVIMAESGDATYTMARGFLLK